MKRNVKKKKGFTLIEIIIVISIIAVLAAIAVPKYASIQKDAKVKADIATAKTISDAVTVLVAQEKILETVDKVEITIAAGNDNAANTAEGAAALVGRYLQSIPTSAVNTGKNFKVKVSAGIATVYVEDIEVYPNGADPYETAAIAVPPVTPLVTE